ncbi:MAG TPA: ABC transporter ATP-binding protein [Limnochordales bacterium]
MALLEVQELHVDYRTRHGPVRAVQGVSFTLQRGEALGIVGESGCGKTTLLMAIARLLPDNAHVRAGRVVLEGTDLLSLAPQAMRRLLFRRIGIIFQAAMNSWNPVYTVGEQIVEALRTHEPRMSRQQARQEVAELFALVGLPPERMDQYPHQFSGGMRQRAAIAMALAGRPPLLLADEPTTALDVVVQDRIWRELDRIRTRLGMAMVYISHDVAVVAQVSDRMGVMYAGRLVELGRTADVIRTPRHPYTAGLLASLPALTGPRRPLVTIPGEPPDLLAPPPGCPFHPRCPYADQRCRAEMPPLVAHGPGQHQVACWYPLAGQDVREDFARRAALARHGGLRIGGTGR